MVDVMLGKINHRFKIDSVRWCSISFFCFEINNDDDDDNDGSDDEDNDDAKI